jgi:hypothetical protein
VTTLNKPDKQDPTAPAKDYRPIGSGEPLHKIAQSPMAREMNAFFAPRLAEVGQFGLSKDGITFAGILPAIVLEMPKFENAALGLADVTSAFQLISRKALWEVLCELEDGRIKVKLQRKFLALYSGTNFGLGYYLLEDGTTMVVSIREGVTQGCNFGTLLFNLGYAMLVLKPLQEEFKGKPVVAICIHSDVDEIRLRHEGTQILPARVNRECLKFAGICIGNEGKVSAALVKAVIGPRSKLRNRMIPFLNSPLVTLQNKFVILQLAGGERSLCGYLARGQSAEQAPSRVACEETEILFSSTYEKLLQQPAGTFHPGQPGRHKEQAELPKHYGSRLQPAHAGEPA